MGIELILGALVAGATAASQNVAAQAVKDAYDGLKTLLRDRFRDRPQATVALDQHALDPSTWEAPLKKELETSGAEKDPAILAAARRLQDELTSSGVVLASGQNSMAVGNARNVARDNARNVAPEFRGNVADSAIAIAGGDVNDVRRTTTGLPGQSLRAQFEPILSDLRARPANPAAPSAQLQQKVEAIRDEAGKGTTANSFRIAAWLGELGALAPDVRTAVADTLRSAGSVVSDAVRQAVEQVTESGE